MRVLTIGGLGEGLRKAAFYYPFTLAGTLLFVAGLYLLGAGFAWQNPYALVLSFADLITLLALAAAGRVQAYRFAKARLMWDSSRPFVARRKDLSETVTVDRVKTLFFFRLHVSIRGRLRVGRGAHLTISREVATVGGGVVSIPLAFPVPGVLEATGRTAVRDLFGLTRSRFGEEYRTQRVVLPAGARQPEELNVTAVGGNEDQSRRTSQDEEKYFMREYIPGDRGRDINWKASTRLAQLITRISPYTQEKSKRISLEIRPYKRSLEESLDSVMHLARIKSRLLAFIRAVRQEHPEYTFRVIAPGNEWTLESEEDIDTFGRELSAVFYQAEVPPPAGDRGFGQLVIFTTPFDESLPASLGTYGKTALHIVTTVVANGRRRDRDQPPGTTAARGKAVRPEPETEKLLDTTFSPDGLNLPVPGRWALRRERPRGGVRRTQSLEATIGGSVTEDPISVALL